MSDLAGEVLDGMSGWEGRRWEPTRTGSWARLPRAAGSSVVRDLTTFVNTKAEVPFVRPLPRFLVSRVQRQPSTSFAMAGRERVEARA
jgi:hypothetical protein